MLHREHGDMFERDRTDGMAHRERLGAQGEIYLMPPTGTPCGPVRQRSVRIRRAAAALDSGCRRLRAGWQDGVDVEHSDPTFGKEVAQLLLCAEILTLVAEARSKHGLACLPE